MSERISKLTWALVAFVFGALIVAVISQFGSTRQASQSVTQVMQAPDSLPSIPSNTDYQKPSTRPSPDVHVIYKTITSLEEAINVPSKFGQNAALYSLLLDADETKLLEFLEESKSISHTPNRDAVQQIIFARYAVINPASALEGVKNFRITQQYTLTHTIFDEWSRSDMQGAIAAAKDLPMSQRQIAAQSILSARSDLDESMREEISRELGGTRFSMFFDPAASGLDGLDEDPEVAWHQLTSESKGGPAAYNNLMNVAVMWAQRDGLQVLDKIRDSMGNTQQRQFVLSAVVAVLSRDDPRGVLAHLQQLPQNRETRQMASAVFNSWADMDPAAAFAGASEMDSTNATTTNRQAVLQTWASLDPEAVLGMLDTLPDDVRMTGYRSAMQGLIQQSPSRAAKMIDDIEDQQIRYSLMQQLASQWSQTDPEAALDWIMSQPEELREPNALSITIMHLAESDPEAAFRIASRQSGSSGERMQMSVFHAIARHNIDQALDMLGKINPNVRVEATAAVGTELVQQDPDRALRLRNTLEDDQQADYLNMLVHRWAYADPQSLVKRIDDLPSVKIQSNAAKVLLQQRRQMWGEGLTDDQFASLYNRLNETDRQAIDRMESSSNGRVRGPRAVR